MTIKRDLLIFCAAIIVFICCCVAMLFASEALSTHPAATYGFVGLWGASALIWPLYLVRASSDVIRIGLGKLRSR